MSDERFDRIEHRIDSMEGAILLALREGFASLNRRYNDLDTDLALTEQKVEDNARKTRRINQRLMHLEQRDIEG